MTPRERRALARVVAGNLRRLRAERRYSTRELALRAGITMSYVNDLERAKASPNLGISLALARALGVELAALVAEPTEVAA
ncbi:MAG TPA: helix-turn-helix transcriptional regulator [Salinarimonas sp.]|nr:helix-turn-helix transcriptional regulator [Salinarimonas sp.]